MLDYKILSKKPKTTINDTSALDLLAETFKGLDYEIQGSPIIVSKEYVARPDLISLAVYNDDCYGDLLCKVNGISNPFELNEDMYIFCPNFSAIQQMMKIQGSASTMATTSTNSTNTLTTTSNITGGTSVSIGMEQNSKQKQLSDRRSPGEQTVNNRNYIIDKSLGLVLY